MPLKADLMYNPESKMYKFHIGQNNGPEIDIMFGENDSLGTVSHSLEDQTNNWTLTKSHKKIYQEAYENTNEKYQAVLDNLKILKEKEKQLIQDHLELLGIMKA